MPAPAALTRLGLLVLCPLLLAACGQEEPRAAATGAETGTQGGIGTENRVDQAWLEVDADAPAETLSWRDLLPEGEQDLIDQLRAGEASPSLMSRFGSRDNEQIGTFNAVEDLDGAIVRMPGFILPLDQAKAGSAREFLLLPYHGACIHYPPPPPNQIVFIRSAEPIRYDALWDPVIVEGRMEVRRASSELAEAAYMMAVRSVRPFSEDAL